MQGRNDGQDLTSRIDNHKYPKQFPIQHADVKMENKRYILPYVYYVYIS